MLAQIKEDQGDIAGNKAVFSWVAKGNLCLLWFCFTSPCHWLKKVVPLSQPGGRKSFHAMSHSFSYASHIPVAKSDALQTVALNVPWYAATLALDILITQACNDF